MRGILIAVTLTIVCRPAVALADSDYYYCTIFAPTQPASQVNLGHWAKAGVINLDADGPPGEFQLVIARVSHPLSGGVEHYTVSELVRRNRESGLPELLESVRLFQGVFLETVH